MKRTLTPSPFQANGTEKPEDWLDYFSSIDRLIELRFYVPPPRHKIGHFGGVM